MAQHSWRCPWSSEMQRLQSRERWAGGKDHVQAQLLLQQQQQQQQQFCLPQLLQRLRVCV